MQLTPSQESAVESQKRIAELAFGHTCRFYVFNPRNTAIIKLLCSYQILNVLGESVERNISWEIGKKGKVSDVTL